MPPIVSNAHNWRQVRGIDFVFSGRWFRCRKKKRQHKATHTQTSETITRAHTTATTVKRESYPLCRVCECVSVCVVHYVSTQSNPQHTRTHTHTLGLCERVYTPCNICNIVWTGGREGGTNCSRNARAQNAGTTDIRGVNRIAVLWVCVCVHVCSNPHANTTLHNVFLSVLLCMFCVVCCRESIQMPVCVCVCVSFSLSLYSSPFNGLWPRVQLTNTN